MTTLFERLQRELDLTRTMQLAYLRITALNMSLWETSKRENSKLLQDAMESFYYHKFNEEKIAWLEGLLEEYK